MPPLHETSGETTDASRPWIRAGARWHLPLFLDRRLCDELAGWIRGTHPYEACGLLVGRAGVAAVEVVRVARAANTELERAWDRFTLAPEDWLSIENEARAEDLEVVGIWHSHPDHPALPSRTDLAAAWEGYAYLIASVDLEDVRDWRSWQLQGGVFVEQEILSERSTR